MNGVARAENHTHSAPPNLLEDLLVPETRLVSSFHFEEQRIQTLAAGVFIFGQPGLEQTSEAKSVAHTHRGVTVQALVRLARARGERLSEAVETHLRETQIAGARC